MKMNIRRIEKKINIVYTGKSVKFLPESRLKIEGYWNKIIKSGKQFYRGEVFAIEKITENNQEIRVNLFLSDYAHYVYTLHHPEKPKEFPCKVAHALILIETVDGYLILGKMASHTAHSGKYQCVGGGIDFSDVSRGKIDFLKNIKRELTEEVGLDMKNKLIVQKLEQKYIKTKGLQNSFAIIYKMNLQVDRKYFENHFIDFQNQFREKGEKTEFDELIFINKKNFKRILKKIKDYTDDYIIPLLKIELNNWDNR